MILLLLAVAQTLDLGSRRELFVDAYLVDRLEGARLHLSGDGWGWSPLRGLGTLTGIVPRSRSSFVGSDECVPARAT